MNDEIDYNEFLRDHLVTDNVSRLPKHHIGNLELNQQRDIKTLVGKGIYDQIQESNSYTYDKIMSRKDIEEVFGVVFDEKRKVLRLIDEVISGLEALGLRNHVIPISAGNIIFNENGHGKFEETKTEGVKRKKLVFAGSNTEESI